MDGIYRVTNKKDEKLSSTFEKHESLLHARQVKIFYRIWNFILLEMGGDM